MAFVRASRLGTRAYVMVRMSEIIEHLRRQEGLAQDAQIPSQKAYNWFSTLTPSKAEAAVKDNVTLWHGSVGPSDAIYIPANHLLGERVNPGQDVIGFRMSVLALKDDKGYEDLKNIRKAAEAAKLSCDVVVHSIRVLRKLRDSNK